MSDKITVKRLIDAIYFAHKNHQDIGNFNEMAEDPVYRKYFEKYSADFRYDEGAILVEFSFEKGLFIDLYIKSLGELRVAFEPFARFDIDKLNHSIPWSVTGCWVDIIEKYVLNMEEKKRDLGAKLNQKLRLQTLYS